MPDLKENIELFVRDLPDAEGARRFFEQVTAEHPRASAMLARDAGLLSDALALAAWSPLLATTLAQHPDYLSWLARERTHASVKTSEELGESLARFALTHSQLDPQVLLARFRRRELLRMYLHDIRKTSTLVEITEELSNLADSILQYALDLAEQELENLYGPPMLTTERGRKAPASFSIVALGKLGSCELNYASDIDLLFLYSDDGTTTGKGARNSVSNREYFCKLAERVAQLVGQQTGEGAAYRVDLRLRPHGRDGALCSSLAEAARYYREVAQAWELQALIRSRAAAGSAALYALFADAVRGRVYRPDETVARALAHVRLAKQKIDRHHRGRARGFNVKLGRGGIREIEFIAQALQLAHGGHDVWLHAPHTLISLGRLADRGLITERERTELSEAYTFLRTLEHRLQMEHGLQTHSVPEERERRTLVARRMDFAEPNALDSFNRTLQAHTANVRAAYDRVFRGSEEASLETVKGVGAEKGPEAPAVAFARVRPTATMQEPPTDAETAAATAAATVFAPRLGGETEAVEVERLARFLLDTAQGALNSRRALTLTARVAASLDKSEATVELSEDVLVALVRLCGASEFFGEMLASNPALIPSLMTPKRVVVERDHRALLRAAVDGEKSFRADLSALRRAWAHLLLELGARDAAGEISLRESNRLQTALAAAGLGAGHLIARHELARRHSRLDAEPRLAVLGLGRLGSCGMDYGSDLDVIFIYDESVPSPVAALTHDEAYSRLVELLVSTLSSMTRDGHLYRVDMRLRPDGKNGAAAIGKRAFVDYVKERAGVWEWLAYVKLRAVGGDLELGRLVENEARHAIHETARRAGPEVLRIVTRRMRGRLERERAKPAGRAVDIKYGRGGMLDVYFATRFLQLRDNVPDYAEDRSTQATLARLHVAGSLGDSDYGAMSEGYALLRTLDHFLRLIIGRSTRLPTEGHPALHDVARCMGYPSAHALTEALAAHLASIRAAYERITEGNDEW